MVLIIYFYLSNYNLKLIKIEKSRRLRRRGWIDNNECNLDYKILLLYFTSG